MRERWQTLPEPLPADPMPVARDWLAEARDGRVQRNPDAMSLATVDAGGRPSVRVVLCKAIVADPGYLVFYTNYDSRKGRELRAAPRAAVVFQWDPLGRQLRVEGPVQRSPAAESDAYFASRPWQSRLAAITSDQSAPVATRAALLERLRANAARFRTPDPLAAGESADDPKLPRPANWGGFRLWAEAVELWVEGAHRLHERVRFERALRPADADGFAAGTWRHERLQP